MLVSYSELSTVQKIKYISVNIQASIGIIGLLGNVLAMCVFSRPSLRNHSYSFYWRVTAVSDSILLLHTFKNWVVTAIDDDSIITPFFCANSEFQPHVAGFISLWMLALISIDRLLAIAYPTRFEVFRKRWFQITLVGLIVAYSVLANIQLATNYRVEFTRDLNTNRTRKICFLPPHIHYRNSYSILINVVLVNLVINNLMDLKLILSIKAAKKKTRMRVHGRQTTIRDRKFAISSIALNVASCLLKIPFAVALYASTYFEMNRDEQQMIFKLTGAILVIDNGDLFFINMFVNSIFYREFLKMIRLK